MRPAGVFGDVATDSAGLLARRIRSEIEPLCFHGFREVKIYDARLDDRALVLKIDLQDLVHARESEDDAPTASDGASTQPGAGAARDDSKILFVGKTHDRGDVIRGLGEADVPRQRTLNA